MTITTYETARHSEPLVTQFEGFDYLELYVGNTYHAAHFYRTTFGFVPVAYSGLETGERGRVSFLMQQGNIRLLLTAAVTPDSPIAQHVHRHGDSIKDLAISVPDAERAFQTAVAGGAVPVMEPTAFEGDSGRVVKATVAAFGSTEHSFVEREGEADFFLPRFAPYTRPLAVNQTGLTEIDHVAISVEAGQLDRWVEFYRDVLGFHQSHHEDVKTQHSAMNSKVMQNVTGTIKFPIMEPAPGSRKSQIEEYLAYNHGPGAQHIALISHDIVATIGKLRENGIDFLDTPDAYYSMLEGRVGKIDAEISALHKFNILVDRDEWGYLMQIFTKPLQSRPTLFFEVIQRVGAKGFGGGNIQALFMALEQEQAARGNL
jgi:4-hydroxyphenylpyruvate dioxygenase